MNDVARNNQAGPRIDLLKRVQHATEQNANIRQVKHFPRRKATSNADAEKSKKRQRKEKQQAEVAAQKADASKRKRHPAAQ